MRCFVALRWRYRVLDNVRAKLELVQQLMRYRYDSRPLKKARTAIEKVDQFSQQMRETERETWRDYNFFRYCEAHGLIEFELPYDETVSVKADDLYMQTLLVLKLHYKRILRQTPQEWARVHRRRIFSSPLRRPPALAAILGQRKAHVQSILRERMQRLRWSLTILIFLLSFCFANLGKPYLGLMNFFGQHRSATQIEAAPLLPTWLPPGDYRITEHSDADRQIKEYRSEWGYVRITLWPEVFETENLGWTSLEISGQRIRRWQEQSGWHYLWSFDQHTVLFQSDFCSADCETMIAFLDHS